MFKKFYKQTVLNRLNNQSLSHLSNIGNIYLNESMVQEYKCLFVRFSSERLIRRKIGHIYTFYKSINLLTSDPLQRVYDAAQCELMFHLFQFRIHFNLRADYENELFYDKCGRGEDFDLIKTSNNYKHNYEKCFSELVYANNEKSGGNSKDKRVFIRILTDYVFYILIGLIMSILIPAFCFICNHLYFDYKRSKKYQQSNFI